MKRSQYLLSGIVLSLLALFTGCTRSESESATIDPAKLKAYAPLPEVMPGKEPITDERVTLGRMLYFDTRLAQQEARCQSLTSLVPEDRPQAQGTN